jgi:hypothetical protein
MALAPQRKLPTCCPPLRRNIIQGVDPRWILT